MSAAELLVTAHGQARIRVEGSGVGSLRVGRERRWVRGDFDETFVVRPEGERYIKVSITGLGGHAGWVIEQKGGVNIQSPPIEASFPPVTCRVRLPRARGLETRRISAPRVVHLTRAPIQSTLPETPET